VEPVPGTLGAGGAVVAAEVGGVVRRVLAAGRFVATFAFAVPPTTLQHTPSVRVSVLSNYMASTRAKAHFFIYYSLRINGKGGIFLVNSPNTCSDFKPARWGSVTIFYRINCEGRKLMIYR
jgi:hypothetical protein